MLNIVVLTRKRAKNGTFATGHFGIRLWLLGSFMSFADAKALKEEETRHLNKLLAYSW